MMGCEAEDRAYSRGYAAGQRAGIEYTEKRFRGLIEEAVQIGEKKIPKNERERSERAGGMEVLLLLLYRVEGLSCAEAAAKVLADYRNAERSEAN